MITLRIFLVLLLLALFSCEKGTGTGTDVNISTEGNVEVLSTQLSSQIDDNEIKMEDDLVEVFALLDLQGHPKVKGGKKDYNEETGYWTAKDTINFASANDTVLTFTGKLKVYDYNYHSERNMRMRISGTNDTSYKHIHMGADDSNLKIEVSRTRLENGHVLVEELDDSKNSVKKERETYKYDVPNQNISLVRIVGENNLYEGSISSTIVMMLKVENDDSVLIDYVATSKISTEDLTISKEFTKRGRGNMVVSGKINRVITLKDKTIRVNTEFFEKETTTDNIHFIRKFYLNDNSEPFKTQTVRYGERKGRYGKKSDGEGKKHG